MNGQGIVVITGAAQGLGLALTERCLARGLSVVMADSDEKALCQAHSCLLAFSKQILPVVCDVSDRASVDELKRLSFKHFGRVDWLINNAGVSGHLAPIWEMDSAEVACVMDVNFYGVLNVVQAFMPALIAQTHRSRLINIASVYGLCSGSLMGPYAISKQAVVALSESLYFDLGRLKHPVDVSVACPSFINTGLIRARDKDGAPVLEDHVADLMSRARSALDVAESIIQLALKGQFYILPDKEIKASIEARALAMVQEEPPPLHSLEKIMRVLARRVEPVACG